MHPICSKCHELSGLYRRRLRIEAYQVLLNHAFVPNAQMFYGEHFKLEQHEALRGMVAAASRGYDQLLDRGIVRRTEELRVVYSDGAEETVGLYELTPDARRFLAA